MPTLNDATKTQQPAKRLPQAALLTVVTILMFAIIVGLTVLAAGTWDLPFFWAVFATQGLIGVASLFILDPDLIAERVRPRGKDEDPMAKIVLSILWFLTVGLAALDVGRWHFSDSISQPVQLLALFVQSIGWIGFTWAMHANRYFSSAIRLQPDREQKVVMEGPYRWIRHPGYAFGTLAFVFQSLALGSLISVVPALLIVAYLLYRTMLEERMLNSGLPGYSQYASQVRYRWVPGIW